MSLYNPANWRLNRLLALGTPLLLVLACASPGPAAAPVAQAGLDAAMDAGPDAGLDAGPDSAADLGETAAPPWQLPAPATLGGQRPARLYVPKSYDGSQALPVVLAMPGYDNTSEDLDNWLQLRQRVDSDGFALILADGLTDTAGSPYWNATDTCCDYDGTGVDDAGYLFGLLDELAGQVHTDPARVTALGHSAGGFMAYRLACERADRIAAVVSVAGSGYVDAQACVPSAAVSVLQVHGLQDDVMPFGGDSEAPGALEMLERWGGYAGCDLDSWQAYGAKLALVKGAAADQATALHYAKGCQPGVAVELWRLPQADHEPSFKPAFAQLALGWALQKHRP
jgi:polyhydroxybutyrate depolymerase